MAKARILLVEDEAFIRDLVSEILQEAELDVIEASNGDEAIAMLEAEQFDLVMTDVHMTGRTDGIGVARSVRARQPKIPVIFATGRPETLNALGTGSAGGVSDKALHAAAGFEDGASPAGGVGGRATRR